MFTGTTEEGGEKTPRPGKKKVGHNISVDRAPGAYLPQKKGNPPSLFSEKEGHISWAEIRWKNYIITWEKGEETFSLT